MFQDTYSRQTVSKALCESGSWRSVPSPEDARAWQTRIDSHPARRALADWIIREAAHDRQSTWPVLLATQAMAFWREGSRLAYENPYFDRQRRLAVAVVAECLGRGDLDEVINGVMLLCEQSSWCVPAHYNGSRAVRGDALAFPLPDRPTLDLFAAEAGVLLAETVTLLGARLEEAAPGLVDRVKREVIHRVVEPMALHEDWWWWSGQNNWTPWIASNVMAVSAMLVEDRELDVEVTWRGMGLLDRYIERYPADGACDEGVGYWNVGPGAMLLGLEVLRDRTGGEINVYATPRIREMASYVANAYLGHGCFLPFADVHVPPRVDAARVYRYGQRCDLPRLRALAIHALRGFDDDGDVSLIPPSRQRFGALSGLLRRLWWIELDEDARLEAVDHWYPASQVLVAFERGYDGAVLAAKAGHNAENHNHIDVGQFALQFGAAQAVVDPGVGPYTRKTFSRERYTIWSIGADAHAVPVINGHRQQAAAGCGHVTDSDSPRAAREVQAELNEGSVRLEMDLAACYDDAAELVSLRRDLVLHRKDGEEGFALRDVVEVREGGIEYVLPLVTPMGVVSVDGNVVTLERDGSKVRVEVTGPGVAIHHEVLPRELDTVLEAWDCALTRIGVAARTAENQAEVVVRICAV